MARRMLARFAKDIGGSGFKVALVEELSHGMGIEGRHATQRLASWMRMNGMICVWTNNNT